MSGKQKATEVICTKCHSNIPFDGQALRNHPNKTLHAKVKAHMRSHHPNHWHTLNYFYSDGVLSSDDMIEKVEVHVFSDPSGKAKNTLISCDECGMTTWLSDHVHVVDDGKIERSVESHIALHHPDHAYQIYYDEVSNDGKGVAVDHARICVLHPTEAQEPDDDSEFDPVEEAREPDDDSKFDPVDHPRHYDKNGVECIDWIRMCLTPEEFRGYLKGNSLKYLWRNEHKGNPVQDLGKAGWYVDKLRAFSSSDALTSENIQTTSVGRTEGRE